MAVMLVIGAVAGVLAKNLKKKSRSKAMQFNDWGVIGRRIM
jgi:uncharacterized membrane protein YeaQ/YmgE (transglycosylase-associated protein family)